MKQGNCISVQLSLHKLAAMVVLASFTTNLFAQSLDLTGATIRSENKPGPRLNSEFYSTKPDVKLLIPVHIWGEVTTGGTYYLTPGSTIEDAISESGGPLSTASLSSVQINRTTGRQTINLLEQGKEIRVNTNDIIYVDRSFKADMRLVFAGMSIFVSLAALAVVLTRM